MATLTFQPLLPSSVWMALLLGALLLLGIYAWRRPPVASRRRWALIVGMMGTSFTLILVLLLNPQWVIPAPTSEGKPVVTILLDTSASMATADGPQNSTRLAAAASLASETAGRLKNSFDLQFTAFSDEAKPVSGQPNLIADGASTDLAAGLRLELAQKRTGPRAIWLLSDGIPTAPGGLTALEQAVRAARTLDIPIYTTTLGTDRAAVDLAVDLRYAQDMAFVGQPATVVAQLRHNGLPRRQVSVSLLSGEKILATQTVQLADQGVTTVRFPVQPSVVGVWTYEVRAEALPGETVVSNNSALYVLKVVDRPARVLVLEGRPYWDSKFLLQTLAAVPAVRVDSAVRLKEGRFVVRTSAGPVAGAGPATAPAGGGRENSWQVTKSVQEMLCDADHLKEYQVLVLGREAEAFLTPEAMSAVQRWVAKEGGCLLCYRGAPAATIDDRLARLMPVTWSAGAETHYNLRVTETGQGIPWLTFNNTSGASGPSELPPLAMRTRQESRKPLAVVAATADVSQDSAAAVVYQPYGAGRVVVIEGSGMWRWAFVPPAKRTAESPYDALWQGMIRWVVSGGGLQPGQSRLLRTDSTIFRPAEVATATLLVRPELVSAVQPQVELFDGRGQRLGQFAPAARGDEAGVYSVGFGKLPEGSYRAAMTGVDPGDPAGQIAFEIRDPGVERLDLKARPDLMARIAHETGGQVLSGAQADELVQGFQAHQAASRPPRLERRSAWDRASVLIAALGLWTCSWGLRRYWGLV